MIVDPDFLSHWKTRMLVGLLADKSAPLYVIALWAHCHSRRTDQLPGQPGAIAGICGFDGDAKAFVSALTQSGFLEKSQDGFVAHGWAEKNARLLHNWEAGKLGGRPRKENPVETQGLSKGCENGNPVETLGGGREERSRVEKRGIEKTKKKSSSNESSQQRDADAIILDFSQNTAYSGIDVRQQFGKMQNWCRVNKKTPTERRFVNWLNRCDVPLFNGNGKPTDHEKGFDQ